MDVLLAVAADLQQHGGEIFEQTRVRRCGPARSPLWSPSAVTSRPSTWCWPRGCRSRTGRGISPGWSPELRDTITTAYTAPMAHAGAMIEYARTPGQRRNRARSLARNIECSSAQTPISRRCSPAAEHDRHIERPAGALSKDQLQRVRHILGVHELRPQSWPQRQGQPSRSDSLSANDRRQQPPAELTACFALHDGAGGYPPHRGGGMLLHEGVEHALECRPDVSARPR